jgi:P-type conjugative transfer protein TrbL
MVQLAARQGASVKTSAIDVITASFVTAIQAGTATLAHISLPLLGIFAIIAFYSTMNELMLSGGAGAGDALATTLLHTIKFGIFYWLLVNLVPLTTAAFQTFFGWGLAPAGSRDLAARMLSPSFLLDIGFRIATPLHDLVDRMSGWSQAWNYFKLMGYTIAAWVIILAFAAVSLHLMTTIIEFHLAVLVCTVLLPWGVLQPTAMLAEFCIGWVTGGLVRILVTGAIVGISVPLFATIQLNTTGGGDPTFFSAVMVALTSFIFAVLAWVIPGRAAAIAGRGTSLVLTGSTILAGAASAARGGMMVRGAVQGVSKMLGQ